ncbi:MAG: hypothetical protein Edafosvirus8_27 [Edafosvirus sp.]|uniref:Uncharacterized protein n=1 Tax=Edafosvirus sp. TaxID=2487765 RepID=A0A3G4ZTQ7_9VIRU|nr:MAG: hypothetical protein Edafosvirus8_27 [Edafosvirus sp.]
MTTIENKIEEYQIICGKPKYTTKRVNELLQLGWILRGNSYGVHDQFFSSSALNYEVCQAMIRKTTNDTTKSEKIE